MGPKKKMRLEEKTFDEAAEIADLNEKIKMLDDMKSIDVLQFDDLPISKFTLDGLTEMDFIEPTKVQRQTLIHSLRGKDVVAASKTGSGKSLAFIIPMLEVLYRNQWDSNDGIGALVITPTRELAYQLFELLNLVGKFHSFSVGLIIGGKDLKCEWKKVDKLNIIICTPGRIMQHITENYLFAMDKLQMVILDEADECLSMGFVKAMKVIFRNIPKSRQTLLFSATQTQDIKHLNFAGCSDAVMCFTHQNSKTITPKKLVQAFYVCKLEDKITFLWTFIGDHLNEKLLVFVATCKQARFISNVFLKINKKMTILMLHGGMHQLRRMAVYDEYCKKKCAVMIATDVAARGLDFPNIHWVVQMDCPDTAKVYIHRVGRTARFTDEGRTVLIVTPAQKKAMRKELFSNNITINEVEEYPSTFSNIDKRMEKCLAKDIDLQDQAKRAFFCFAKMTSKMKQEFCDLDTIDFDAFARSLGLAVTPDIKFLDKKILSLRKSRTKVAKLNSEKTDLEQPENNNKQEKEINKVSIDELFTTSDQPLADLAPIIVVPTKHKRKTVTKYSIAKKINQKGIKVNTKIIFDDDDQSYGVAAKESVLPKEDSGEGVDYSLIMDKIISEDKADRKVHNKKRKEKRKLATMRSEKEAEMDE